ncbi:hypothetical protein F4810DRAFT_715142 [Camillea tinctor]|nr:hypothetical protein F4810DRAFT_715142 [Camillea tinctor]
MAESDTGPITRFPADDLRPIKRYLTTHNSDGKAVFVSSQGDDGDHHRVMVRGKGAANIVYSTKENPVDLTDEKDLEYARSVEPGIHVPNGTVARMIDFAPGAESPMHRALSLDYGVVIEGEFELTLDSGESRIMYPGDVSVNRAGNHKWRNRSTTKSGRMLFILLDCKPFEVNRKLIVEDLGELASEYAK